MYCKKTLLLLSIFLLLTVSTSIINMGGNNTKKNQIKYIPYSSQYTSHKNISINGNEDFHIQASGNWDVDGTHSGNSTHPYVIEGLNITESNSNLIKITNTDVFFVINNCLLYKGKNGIILDNVTNGYIYNCTISNNKFNGIDGGYGIYINKSTNVNISSNNVLNNNYRGINLYYSNRTKISKNSLSDDEISFDYCHNNIISENFLINKHIRFYRSNWNSISNNTIYNAEGLWGITIMSSDFNSLTNNVLVNNQHGIGISFGDLNNVTHNILINNSEYGIFLCAAYNNTITNNTITNNHKRGFFASYSPDTLIMWNDFFCNNYTEPSQAVEVLAYGNNLPIDTHSNFTYNFWDNWISTNTTSDIFLDDPYPIECNISRFDPYPLIFPNNQDLHILLKPKILSPEEEINATVNIEWVPSFDSWGHKVYYNVSYSLNNGTDWSLIASNLVNGSYVWNVNFLEDGDRIILKVTSYELEGLTAECISNIITFYSNGIYTTSNTLTTSDTLTSSYTSTTIIPENTTTSLAISNNSTHSSRTTTESTKTSTTVQNSKSDSNVSSNIGFYFVIIIILILVPIKRKHKKSK